jgi:hypothetical protein
VSTSCEPRCQRLNTNGPDEIGRLFLGLRKSFRHTWLKFSPASECCGIGAVPMSAFQAAYGLRNVTVTVLPDTATLLMSSQPSRDVMSNDWFISVCQRNRKSAPVIGWPSLHFAAFL